MLRLTCNKYSVIVKNISLRNGHLGCALANDDHDDLYDLGFKEADLTQHGLTIDQVPDPKKFDTRYKITAEDLGFNASLKVICIDGADTMATEHILDVLAKCGINVGKEMGYEWDDSKTICVFTQPPQKRHKEQP